MFSLCEDRCMVVCDAVRSGISIRHHIPQSSNLHCVCSLFNDAVGLRYCATSRRVSGSIPIGVAGDFFRSYRRNHVPWVD